MQRFGGIAGISRSTIMKYLRKVYEAVKQKVAERIPDRFGVIFDGNISIQYT
jgi:hypothetical protein